MRTLLSISSTFAGAVALHAQCLPPAQPIPSQIGMYATAYSLLPWDPDGPGPEPEGLIAGGDFRFAGDGPTEFVAFWSGTRWDAMGAGLPGPVYALTLFNGVPIAGGPVVPGGPFSTGVATWDGSAWHAVPGVPALGTIRALLVRGGQLIAGGDNYRVGAWDGNAWSALGAAPFAIRSLADYQGTLVAGGGGGEFSYAARWTGANWVTFGQFDGWWQAQNYVYGLVEYDGTLVAAGSFWEVGGQNAPGLAAWDGLVWRPIAPELYGGSYAARTFGGRLYAAGLFGTSQGLTGSLLAFDGPHWAPVSGAPTEWIRSLAVWSARLALGGSFRDGPAQTSPGVAAWDGQAWEPLGLGLHAGSGGQIAAMTAYAGRLVAAGAFEEVRGEEAGSVASWDGVAWRPMGAALSAAGWPFPRVVALAVHDGELIAAGNFTAVNGQPASGLAIWDGAAWRPFPSGTGLYATALGSFEGRLIAAPNPADPMVRGVGMWDGARWVAMTAGIPSRPAYFASTPGGLYAGLAGGGYPDQPAPVYRWTGPSWSLLPGPVFSALPQYGCDFQALAFQDDLFLGGRFLMTGGVALNHVARWDGTAWRPLGGGIPGGVSARVDALLAFNGELIVAGGFNAPGPGIARWNGSSWLTIPEAAGGAGTRLAEFNGRLIIARDQCVVTASFPSFARWDPFVPTCYANCDCSAASPVLNASDFYCFLSRFAAADPYANCDGSTTPPTLNIADFICFQSRFAAGCP